MEDQNIFFVYAKYAVRQKITTTKQPMQQKPQNELIFPNQ
jgi:hypothetical protein